MSSSSSSQSVRFGGALFLQDARAEAELRNTIDETVRFLSNVLLELKAGNQSSMNSSSSRRTVENLLTKFANVSSSFVHIMSSDAKRRQETTQLALKLKENCSATDTSNELRCGVATLLASLRLIVQLMHMSEVEANSRLLTLIGLVSRELSTRARPDRVSQLCNQLTQGLGSRLTLMRQCDKAERCVQVDAALAEFCQSWPNDTERGVKALVALRAVFKQTSFARFSEKLCKFGGGGDRRVALRGELVALRNERPLDSARLKALVEELRPLVGDDQSALIELLQSAKLVLAASASGGGADRRLQAACDALLASATLRIDTESVDVDALLDAVRAHVASQSSADAAATIKKLSDHLVDTVKLDGAAKALRQLIVATQRAIADPSIAAIDVLEQALARIRAMASGGGDTAAVDSLLDSVFHVANNLERLLSTIGE
jgi:hypothetical protein